MTLLKAKIKKQNENIPDFFILANHSLPTGYGVLNWD